MTSRHYERSYRTARAVFAAEELIGWLIAVTGAFYALTAFFQRGLDGPFSGLPALTYLAGSAIPGLVALVAGIIAVANSQTNRAAVDSAEMLRDMLAIARRATDQPGTSNARSRVEPIVSPLQVE